VRTSDRAFAIDAAAIGLLSVAICLLSRHPIVMDAVVAGLIVARLGAYALLPRAQRGRGFGLELGLFALCLALGAFNDWNSVTRHRIYDYTVPLEAPAQSLVPLWMLAAWGLIVRFILALVTWSRLALPAPRAWPRPALRVGFVLALVVVTRQAIYRLHDDPVWSWAPFALALAAALAVLRPDRRRLALLLVVAALGPAVEALYIQLGGLHAYHLGWLAGVPLWIALWWVLAVLVWSELSQARAPRDAVSS